ncbi:MAG: beta-N-acetylhexosaminidase [Pyrinomonadaceae bacterium]
MRNLIAKAFFAFGLLIYCTILANAQHRTQKNEDLWRGPHSIESLKAAPVALIPFPRKAEWSGGRRRLGSDTRVVFLEADREAVGAAVRSVQEVLSVNGKTSQLQSVETDDRIPPNVIFIGLDGGLPSKAEGYSLEITPRQVTILGKDAAGAFYAVQTLRQLITKKGSAINVPLGKILDWPAFQLRGFMHDTGRNFQEIDSLKKQLDHLAAYKFNTFHWHLTDNPAWRPQTRIYPQLNDAKNRKAGRDPEKTYSFDDIRELVRYARERHIQVIPELDMPGHSAFFEPSFGFKMHTEQGMKVLEDLIDEFCKEIPASDFPIIHLGSDEVRIPNPDEFIWRMTARLKANGRRAMVWNPGLKNESGTIEQLWSDAGTEAGKRTQGNPFVDSYAGYLNSYDALTLIRRYFFQQPCGRYEGDSIALGGILCMWPDVRVDDKGRMFLHSPVWPGALAYSEAVWCGRPAYENQHMDDLPSADTEAGKHFREFEQRLARHRDRFFKNEPFPFVQSGHVKFRLLGPYMRGREQPIDTALAPEKNLDDSLPEKRKSVYGGVHRFDTLLAQPLSTDANETVYLETQIFSRTAKQIHAWIGFETATRSSRKSAGIPPQGKWDANGGAIFVNGKELAGPRWQNPGANRYLQETWFLPANEIPYTNEEFYWSRKPAIIDLKKGWNKVLVSAPRAYNRQNWMFAFVPVRLDGNQRWVEDLSINFR